MLGEVKRLGQRLFLRASNPVDTFRPPGWTLRSQARKNSQASRSAEKKGDAHEPRPRQPREPRAHPRLPEPPPVILGSQGGNRDCLDDPARRETAVLGEIAGAGIVKHIWMTMMSWPAEPHELRQTVLRIFWDGHVRPSVAVPLGDFFGIGFGLRRNFTSCPCR